MSDSPHPDADATRTAPARSPLPASHPSDLTGRMIGRYRVRECIGRGGMGEVYRAKDTLLKRDVALKRVRGRPASLPIVRRQIIGEARRASRLNDPRIAAIYDVLEHDDEVLIVMEYVEGPSLRDVMAENPDIDRFWTIAEDCTRALGVAHRAGLVHRDIKPANIMLSASGQVKILDFGLAHRAAGEGVNDATSTESLSDHVSGGTPAYMAPEAHLGRPTDHRADLFALGTLFYEFLAGSHPFRGPTLGVVMQKILNEDPTPLVELDRDVPADLSDVVTRLLAKRPEHRYQSADELLEDITQVRSGEVVSVPLPPPTRKSERRRSHIAPTITTTLVAAAVSYLAFFGGWETIRTELALAPLPGTMNLAVLPISSSDGEGEPLALGMTHLLHDGLRRLGLSPPLQAASLGETFRENVSTPAAARETQGANLALRCDVSVGDRRVTGRLELVDTRSGHVLRRETLRSDAPRGFLEGALVRTAGMLGVGADSLPSAELMGLDDEGPGTLDFYLNGLGHLQFAKDSTSVAAALDWFQLARRTDPGSAMSVAAIAGAERRMYRATRDGAWLERAVETARSAIALDSTRASARQELALALWSLDRRDEAIEAMAEAVRLDPTDEDAVLALGRFHGRLGRVDREATVYRASAAERPHAWKPHYWLATRVHYEHGHFDEARAEFAEVVRLAPDHHIGYESLGGLQVLEGSYAEAAANLERAIELNPSPEALTNLATAYFNMRDFDRAFETFNEVFRHEFVDYFVWMNLGDAYYYAPGKRSLADEAYRQAWRLGKEEHEKRPYDVSILANLAQFLPRVGEPDTARTYLARALEAEPENPMIHYSAAITNWQLGNRDRALAWLERAVAGGHPVQWLRDSPIFDEWRDDPRFRAFVGEENDSSGDG